ncbi:MAG: hypothetical protein KF884_03990 [Fimbriimonadaceae bacterium]|nr:hypothetical protein [Fimbriimonadaceae bacterium]QYK59250.1 MAG: hypothetical protein KF884_03990 [Fimbriimonadaceae bacterium]
MRALLLAVLSAATFAIAQEAAVAPAGPGVAQFLTAIEPRELGPTTMGGRIMDIAVFERDKRIFYVGVSGGGVWKTESGGIKLEPVFDKQSLISVGALALSQKDPNVVWAGTGEPSSRNSTLFGNGLYKTTDGGKTWAHMGLKDSKQIGKIAIHPKNDDVVLVAALGHLWGPNDERGLYRTEDGGKSWRRVIDAGPKAGAVDVAFDPKDPNVVLAATWERVRMPHDFVSRGPGSALWRSTDGGKTFSKVTKGLPEGPLGRIGISFHRADPRLVAVTVDAKQGGVFVSQDRGASWEFRNRLNPRPFYFSTPQFDPVDKNRIYLLGVNFHASDDQGKSFRELSIRAHPDHHAIWVDPDDNAHFIIGNDGGLNETRDRGRSWRMFDSMAIGQFYAVAVDMRKPYYVYGGLQDNGSWGGPTQTQQGGVSAWHWYGIGGGDGFHVQVEPEDWEWVYAESQGGALQRLNQVTGESGFIRPRPPQGEQYRFNWSSPLHISPHNSSTLYFGANKLFKSTDRGKNWKVMSPDLTTDDKEKQKPPQGDSVDSGAERHCTIITIGESPVKPGVLWVGTDDGLVQLSTDDGSTWKEVSGKLPGAPKGTWVSRVRPSKFKEGRCYVTLDGHRNNDYSPYVYVTEDMGETWTKITDGLEEDDSCYVIEEGRLNEDLLYLGTERGLLVSMDRGKSWTRFTTGSYPNARVDDLVVHPREMDLVVGTHGRSIWILPTQPLEQLKADDLKKDVVVTVPRTVYFMGRVSPPSPWGNESYASRNTQPGTTVAYYLREATDKKVVVQFLDASGKEVAKLDGTGKAGLNAVNWRPGRRNLGARSGDFTVVVKVGDAEHRTALRVEDLTWRYDRENAVGN